MHDLLLWWKKVEQYILHCYVLRLVFENNFFMDFSADKNCDHAYDNEEEHFNYIDRIVNGFSSFLTWRVYAWVCSCVFVCECECVCMGFSVWWVRGYLWVYVRLGVFVIVCRCVVCYKALTIIIMSSIFHFLVEERSQFRSFNMFVWVCSQFFRMIKKMDGIKVTRVDATYAWQGLGLVQSDVDPDFWRFTTKSVFMYLCLILNLWLFLTVFCMFLSFSKPVQIGGATSIWINTHNKHKQWKKIDKRGPFSGRSSDFRFQIFIELWAQRAFKA